MFLFIGNLEGEVEWKAQEISRTICLSEFLFPKHVRVVYILVSKTRHRVCELHSSRTSAHPSPGHPRGSGRLAGRQSAQEVCISCRIWQRHVSFVTYILFNCSVFFNVHTLTNEYLLHIKLKIKLSLWLTAPKGATPVN